MKRRSTRAVLAAAVILIGASIVAALIFVAIPNGNENVLNVALGLVLAWGGTAVNFYFGTSQSSADKTEMLATRPSGEVGDPVHTQEEPSL